MEWSPSGKLLCTGSLDKMAQVWSIDGWAANAAASGGAKPSSEYFDRREADGVFDKSYSLVAKSVWRLRGHEGRITCVRFVSGESHLLTGIPPSLRLAVLGLVPPLAVSLKELKREELCALSELILKQCIVLL